MLDEKTCDLSDRTEHVSGNIFIRPVHLAVKGEKISGHTHNFDHTTIVFQGSLHVKATSPDGSVTEKDFTAPAHFLVRKEVEHEITALECKTVFWCVYSHRDAQGNVVQDNDGWTYKNGVYPAAYL